MKKLFVLTSVFLLVSFLSHSQEDNIKTTSFGKGILNIIGKDSTWSMNMSARFQLLSTNKWNSINDKLTDPSQDFLVRRARLKFNGFVYNPKIEYKLELGLANRDMSGASEFTSNSPNYVMDAVVMWNFYENFSLWAGQTKLPGNVERVISSGNLQLVDRSMLNSEFNIDRDMGIQLRHESKMGNKFLMREILAVSQGEGRNITTGNLGGHQYTGRIELLPFGEFASSGEYSGGDLKREKTPKLMLASTYNINNNAVKTRGSQGSYMANDIGFYETDVNTLFVDAVFKYNGFSFMGEYAKRDAKDPFAKNSNGTLTGAKVQEGQAYNLQAGYLFKSNYEVAARYTNVELNKTVTGKNPEKQFTLGLSRYIVGHKLKLQTDVSYLSKDLGTDEVMWRLQMDIHF